MKKCLIFCLVFALILPLLSRNPAQAQEKISPLAQTVKNKMAAAVDNYKEGRITEGAILLLDVVKLVRPESSWPAGFIQNINSSREAFKEEKITGGVAYVKTAIGILKPGYSMLTAQEKGGIANIAQTVLSKIQSAGEYFKTGKADEAVVCILESLLLLGPLD
ncbi:MAG: hypothetical protein JXB26_07085 [Candidatus Aminicenantes bacterium]|nr:hypothetical protein [Candidatus Aminicenantes bacterium]